MERKFKQVFNVCAIADGGPDWSVKSVVNLMSLGSLWEETQLDILVVQSHAPTCSRFNPIERSLSFLMLQIVGVILHDDIDGDAPKHSDQEGWSKVFGSATDCCAKFGIGNITMVSQFLSKQN